MNLSAARFHGLLDAARALQPATVALRRRLHEHPEQGLALPTTQAEVLHSLADLDVKIHKGSEISSVVAVLDGARPGPVVLLRGDMDALPLVEATGLPFASAVPGSMHACGHDLHTAMLASAARLLHARRADLAGQVVFMFQPGEEGCHGARIMLDEGVLDVADGPVERALALHVTSKERSGVLRCRRGPIMAGADAFTVRVTGRGGHASTPVDAIDPVPAAAAMVGALQTAVTRRMSVFEPTVVTVARITAGTTSNIIPETAELQGTLRTMSDQSRKTMIAEIHRVCTHVGAAHGCQVEVEMTAGYPVTVNDPDVADRVLDLADVTFGQGHTTVMPNPLMGAEDFSYVLQRVPGAMAFLGACPPGTDPADAPPNHSNRVVFDEAALPLRGGHIDRVRCGVFDLIRHDVPMRSVCVVGLGLIGGSVLRAAAGAGRAVWGAAEGSDADDAAADGFTVLSVDDALLRAAAEDALVVIAVPLTAVDQVLRRVAELAPACLLTDVVSVKGKVADLVARRTPDVRFAGGHPMAGASVSGWAAGSAELFRGAAWVVTADEDTSMDAWRAAADLALDCGAGVVPTTSSEHDAAVARISHLPHVLAAVLAACGADGGPLALALAAGSFGDGTRVMGSRPELVLAMCEGNRPALLAAVDEALGKLGAARGALASTGSLSATIRAGHQGRGDLDAHRATATARVHVDLHDVDVVEELLLVGAQGGRVVAFEDGMAVAEVPVV